MNSLERHTDGATRLGITWVDNLIGIAGPFVIASAVIGGWWIGHLIHSIWR